jgi:predicted membrane-bound mannosyltransferase
MVAVYCAIPYKAPWNVLSALHGMIILAGIGVVWLARRLPRLLVVALVAIGAAHLGWQARAASFQYASNPRNPWVYAHTGTDVLVIVKQVEALAAVHPAGHAMPVQIVTRGNLWPLPWYFRRYPGVRWWNGVSDTAPLAPVILATPDMEPALLHRIYEVPPPGHREMYVNMFDRYVELRPSVEVRGYVAKALWDDLQEAPR